MPAHKQVKIVLMIIAVLVEAGCQKESSEVSRSGMVTSSTYLETAVREFDSGNMSIASMAGAGMCPGHFDIRPSQIEQVHRSKVFFRFDFQRSMDAKILPLAGEI